MPKTTSEQNDERAPKKPRGVRKRVEGRPHKRLDAAVLQKRMSDLASKLKVTEARTVLFKDRLGAYVKEMDIRTNAENATCNEETQPT